MKRTTKQTILMTVLLMLLIVAVAFCVSCTKPEDDGDKSTVAEETTTAPENETTETTTAEEEKDENVLGEGDTCFTFSVVHKSGETVTFTVYTDAETVGEALQEVGLIEGEDSQFGLYVKKVNGETLDYDTDGMYWAFYENDKYAALGVESTPIDEGTVYSFRATRG